MSKVRSTTQKLFVGGLIVAGLTLGIGLLLNMLLYNIFAGIFTLVVGIATLTEVGWKRIKAIFDSKFQGSDITDGMQLALGLVTAIVGVMITMNYSVPQLNLLAGVVIIISVPVLIMQLFQ